jgi:hypothetical protein
MGKPSDAMLARRHIESKGGRKAIAAQSRNILYHMISTKYPAKVAHNTRKKSTTKTY